MKSTVYHSMNKVAIGAEILEESKEFGEPNQIILYFTDGDQTVGVVIPDIELKQMLEATLYAIDENDGSAKETFNDIMDVITQDWY